MRKSHHALVLLLVLCLLIQPLTVSAFEFETPETAAELIEAVPDKTALAADIDIPTEDETLGKLVWYNNFDETDASTATYAAGAYTAGSYSSSLELVENPDSEKTGKALKVTQTSAHGGYQVDFTDNLSTPGDYTVLVDIYVPEESTASGFWTHFIGVCYDGKSSDPNLWNGGSYVKGTGAWYTYKETFQLPGNNLTEESLKAYTQYVLHKNCNGEVYYIDNVRIYCNAYKSAVRPAEYDKNYSQLVYFENFAPDNDFENLTNFKLASTMSEPSVYAGYYAVGNANVEDRVTTYGFELGYADGDDSFRFLDENRSLLSGKVTFYAEIYSQDSDKAYWSVVSKRTSNAGNWSGWGGGVITPRQTKTAKANTSTKLYFDSIALLSTDTHFGAFNTSNQSGAYARAIGVYIQPSNALWLVDSEGESTYSVASGETYTFPTTFNGTKVYTWTLPDGSDYYKAGETVNIADVAGMTWQVSQTVDIDFDDSVSVRTSGVTGIRFKPKIDLASRVNADEIGFLATRDTLFNAQFEGKDENFVLDNEAAQNGKSCVIVRIAKDDIQKYIIEEDGVAAFNALVVGVPMQKETLTEMLHLRSYVTIGNATYYSAVRKESIYSAAKKLTGYEDNEYIQQIIDTCENN